MSMITKEQVAASETGNTDELISFKLSKEEWCKADVALVDIPYFINHARNIFELLYTGFAGGSLSSDEPGVKSLMEVCGRAFKSLSENEAETFATLDGKIRESVAVRTNLAMNIERSKSRGSEL